MLTRMNQEALAADAIIPCPEPLSAVALELVFQSLPSDLRKTHVASLLAANGRKPLDGLLVHCPARTVDAALFVEIQPGRVASFWGPTITKSCAINRNDVAAALIDAGRHWAEHHEIEIVQTLLTDESMAVDDIYQAAGFSIRAQLDYLICHVDTSEPVVDDQLQLAPYTPTDREILMALIAATYDGTYDCPELNGVRDMRHVLDGYAGAGDSGERHWFFVRHDAETVGVLLLAEHTAQDQAELVYMGVVPEARGRGYGLAITRLAQNKTHQLGHARIILAVDTRNHPALDLYARAGFIQFDRRTALLLPLDPS
jgi:RimJ/RimL family protein N-acetyltransferase